MRPRRAIPLAVFAVAAGLAAAGCGSGGEPIDDRGAQLFSERCAGCHTLSAAGARGSTANERIIGPNLDQRPESKKQVLFAIRNGGFSGAIMPQNVVVGEDAETVAEFVSRYAGSKAKYPTSPTGTTGGADAAATK